MKNFMGGGAPDDAEEGLLDNNQQVSPAKGNGGKGGRGTDIDGSESRPPSKMNQDLWLLNLFFKGCALLV